jgi:hypothetical protein
MKIDKNSWHYRFLKWMDSSARFDSSLCPYMRKLIIHLAFMAVMCVLAAFCGIAIFFTMAIALVGWVLVLFPEITLGGVIDQPFLVGTGLLIVFPISFGMNKFFEYRQRTAHDRWLKSRMMPDREPGIFRTYWKALHDKICPVIEFTNTVTSDTTD